jgi:hypothetical protein
LSQAVLLMASICRSFVTFFLAHYLFFSFFGGNPEVKRQVINAAVREGTRDTRATLASFRVQ